MASTGKKMWHNTLCLLAILLIGIPKEVNLSSPHDSQHQSRRSNRSPNTLLALLNNNDADYRNQYSLENHENYHRPQHHKKYDHSYYDKDRYAHHRHNRDGSYGDKQLYYSLYSKLAPYLSHQSQSLLKDFVGLSSQENRHNDRHRNRHSDNKNRDRHDSQYHQQKGNNRQSYRYRSNNDRDQRNNYGYPKNDNKNQGYDNRYHKTQNRYPRHDDRNHRFNNRQQNNDNRYQDRNNAGYNRYSYNDNSHVDQYNNNWNNEYDNRNRDVGDRGHNQGRHENRGNAKNHQKRPIASRLKSYNNLRARLEALDREDDRKGEKNYGFQSLRGRLTAHLQNFDLSPVKSLLRAADDLDCAAQEACVNTCDSKKVPEKKDECAKTCQDEIACNEDEEEDCNASGHDSCEGAMGTGSTKGPPADEEENACC